MTLIVQDPPWQVGKWPPDVGRGHGSLLATMLAEIASLKRPPSGVNSSLGTYNRRYLRQDFVDESMSAHNFFFRPNRLTSSSLTDMTPSFLGCLLVGS